MAEEVARNKPRIAIGSETSEGETSVNITPSQMRPGDEDIVAQRLHDLLAKKRKPKTNQLKSPEEDISGHWKVDISFFTSNSRHTLLIEQMETGFRVHIRAIFQNENWLE